MLPDADGVIGNEPLADEMWISIRVRRDFFVADAQRVLEAARQAYRELHPDEEPDAALTEVICAADALYVILEHAGMLTDVINERLKARDADGLMEVGWRAEVVANEPIPLIGCLHPGDPFALPVTRREAEE